MRIPFIGQAYQNRSIPLSSQRCINWYPEIEPGDSRNVITLQAAAGIELFSTLPAGPLRGMYFSDNLQKLYAVSGNRAYEISRDGSFVDIGSIDGETVVSMAGNGTQIAFATGLNAYIYDTAQGLTLESDIGAVKDVTQQDGYFIFVNTDGQRFKITAIRDGRQFDALDFAAAEGNPDPLVSIEQASRRLWMFGSNSYEVFFNSGAPDFPFTRIDGASFNGYGIAGTYASVVSDSVCYWCSNDGRIYRANGYAPQRISHHGIENSLRQYSTLEDCEACQWTENGHRFIAFTFPNASATWVFDSTSGMWHQRSSGVKGRRSNNGLCVQAWDGETLTAERTGFRIGRLDLDTFTEYGDVMLARRTTQVIHAQQNSLFLGRLELVFEVGMAEQSEDPQARMAWSQDGGVTYGNPIWRSLGKVGEYNQRAVWFRLGKSINRTFDLQITDPVPRNLIDCVIESETGFV